VRVLSIQTKVHAARGGCAEDLCEDALYALSGRRSYEAVLCLLNCSVTLPSRYAKTSTATPQPQKAERLYERRSERLQEAALL